MLNTVIIENRWHWIYSFRLFYTNYSWHIESTVALLTALLTLMINYFTFQ